MTTAQGSTAPTVELAVEGMHCGSCVALIEETLAEHPGVDAARVDLEAGRAFVTYDPTALDVATIAELVTDAGYVASPVG